MIKIHDVEQYSEEWWALRKGRFTASLAKKLITPTGKMSAQCKEEVGRMIAEHMEWQEPDSVIETEWITRGSEMEDEARRWLEVVTDLPVDLIGIVTDEERPFSASPDGALVNDEGLIPVEIKCPKPSTHIKWLLAGGLPDEHKAQVHFQMALMGAPYAVFMSYNPDVEPLIVHVDADDYTDKLTHYMDKFVEQYRAAFNFIVEGDS